MKHLFSLSLFLVFSGALFAQKPTVVSGPMPGYSEQREALVWVQTACAKKITLQYKAEGTQQLKEIVMQNTQTDPCQPLISRFIATELDPGITYEYKILLDGKPASFSYPLKFKTKSLWEWRTDAPPFSFLLGSCLYVNDSAYDRPGKPYGQGTAILQKMADVSTDFMLWMGDNVYLRESDFGSESGIRYRYRHTRANPDLQRLLATRHNYATWDDHDFGDNDACKVYPLKDVTRDCFINYWGNRTYGENNEGIYSTFNYSDAQFFLLDDRYFRDEDAFTETDLPTKTQLGEKQLQWFFQSLLRSRSTFKFVCVGGQFLNEHTDKESYNHFKNERKRIIDFIVSHKISGVIFLTGDRHHTELIRNDNVKAELGYSLYDLTSSAISSRPSNANTTDEATNPTRVTNTLVTENNFCKIEIKGKRKERVLVMSCYDKEGRLKWEQEIKEQELAAKKSQ